MKMWRKVIITTSMLLMATTMTTGCGSKAENTTELSKQDDVYKSSGEDQLAEPEKGDTLATFHIKSYGDITVKLFPKAAPKAVENFVTHAKKGYYDGVIFHRVIDDFMIQGGDPTGTGRGGESIWGEAFEDEFAENLMPIRGALCMANAGANTNGSQFFIVQAETANLEYASVELSEEQKKMFIENGGTPHLVYAHTVFGQVVDGMDVVDAIAAARTVSDAPVSDVIIESIDITELK